MEPIRNAQNAIQSASREMERRRPESNAPDEYRRDWQGELIKYHLQLAAINQGLNPFPTTVIYRVEGENQ